MTCKAKRYNDQYICDRCVLAWDIDDDDPPQCGHAFGDAALQRIKRSLELSPDPRAVVGANLTDGERRILQRVADGAGTHKAIAYDLGCGERTIEVHARRILRKLGAINMEHAVAIGIREGLIT